MNDSGTLVALQAGDHVMKVHASVLADNSDYFKAVVLSGRWPLTPLLVPFVHPAALVRLVQFMYSRHLDVDHTGVHEVLLAARLLGMPNAVTACQDILARHGLARPRPFPWIWAPAWGSPVGPPQLPLRLPEQNRVSSTQPLSQQPVNPQTAPSSFSSMVLTAATSPRESSSRQEHDKPEPERSASEDLNKSSRSGPNSPCPSLDRVKVVVDVAWCDGPVRFQRVLNDNCAAAIDREGLPRERPKKTSKKLNASRDRPEDDDAKEEEEDKTSSGAGSKYNCAYCNLSFKSHHCYAKHRRRHLNPCVADSDEATAAPIGPTDADREGVRDPKGRFSPNSLELNVPFYPCKTCGSKFPSYYFVHKHGKVCDGVTIANANAQQRGERQPEDARP